MTSMLKSSSEGRLGVWTGSNAPRVAGQYKSARLSIAADILACNGLVKHSLAGGGKEVNLKGPKAFSTSYPRCARRLALLLLTLESTFRLRRLACRDEAGHLRYHNRHATAASKRRGGE